MQVLQSNRLSDAFLQVEIDEDSTNLLTINTHRGLFVYNRLPFGVTVAPGEFQSIVDAMIAGLLQGIRLHR